MKHNIYLLSYFTPVVSQDECHCWCQKVISSTRSSCSRLDSTYVSDPPPPPHFFRSHSSPTLTWNPSRYSSHLSKITQLISWSHGSLKETTFHHLDSTRLKCGTTLGHISRWDFMGQLGGNLRKIWDWIGTTWALLGHLSWTLLGAILWGQLLGYYSGQGKSK